MLQLDWVPVYVATSYRIYAADAVDAPSWTLLGETEETRFTLALQAAQSARWFQVRSVVPDALLHSLERDTAPLRQPRTGVAEPARRTRQQTQGTK